MHPAIKILVYFVLLLTLHFLADSVFWGVFATAILTAVLLQKNIFLTRCIRLKWLFLSIFLVYALGTPGEYIANSTWTLLPTKEGIYLGCLQVARLLLALSLLSILFYQTKAAELMLGLNTLLHPLRYFKLDVSKFIVRLLLTLSYVDQFTSKQLNKQHFFSLLQEAKTPVSPEKLSTIVLEQVAFRWVDFIAVLLTATYLVLVLNVGQLR